MTQIIHSNTKMTNTILAVHMVENTTTTTTTTIWMINTTHKEKHDVLREPIRSSTFTDNP